MLVHKHAGKKLAKKDNAVKKYSSLAWHDSFPVDQDTYAKMRKGQIDKTCPNCKYTFTTNHNLYAHFSKVKCKTATVSRNAVPPPPDLVIEINDEDSKKPR